MSYLTTLPLVAKLHIFCAWLIFALVPFTRLVHILVAPLPYLWRKPEVVRWYGVPAEPGFSIPQAVSKHAGKAGVGA